MEEEKYNLSGFYEKKINIFRKDKILSTNAQHKRCKLSFIGNKMRMMAPETVSQIALRNCSLVARGRSYTDHKYYVILVKGVHPVTHSIVGRGWLLVMRSK